MLSGSSVICNEMLLAIARAAIEAAKDNHPPRLTNWLVKKVPYGEQKEEGGRSTDLIYPSIPLQTNNSIVRAFVGSNKAT